MMHQFIVLGLNGGVHEKIARKKKGSKGEMICV